MRDDAERLRDILEAIDRIERYRQDGSARNRDDDLVVVWMIHLEPGRTLLDVSGLLLDLRDLLGVDVDVLTEGSLRWFIRDQILEEAVLV